MSKNNKQKNKNANVGNKKTQVKNPASAKKVVAEEKKGLKKLFSEKNMAIVITAIIVAAILLIGGLVALIRYIVRDEGFDFETSNLSKYVEFTDDYKNFTVDIDYAPMKDIDLKVALLSLQNKEKGKALNNYHYMTAQYTITPGAKVKLWYRGYLIDEETGEEVVVSGMSNFADTTAQELIIGSGQFIPGFELGLVGMEVDKYPKLEKITSGKVEEKHIAYVTFTTNQNGKDVEQKSVRIDMSSEAASDVEENFGKGFREAILGAKIGTTNDKVTVTKGDNEFDYTKVKVDFVTECENGENKPFVVEAYFPFDYSQVNLRNEKVYFEVYVDGSLLYEYPEINDEFIQKLIEDEDYEVTAEILEQYEGATLTDKYLAYAKKGIEDVYAEAYDELLESAIWEYYFDIANVKKYPKSQVEKYYDEYVEDVKYQYSYTGGTLQNSSGQSQTYSDLDSFACAYLGLYSGSDWHAYLESMAKSMVKERMVLYYIMELEGISFTDEEFKKMYDETVQLYVDEYVNQHLAQVEDKTKDDFTEEEFAKYVAARKSELFERYDETFFTERTYYTTIIDMVKEWPEVTTLENRSAYFDKYK